MGAEAVVLSFLYSLLMSMGLIGGSYQDIANAFPDNTAQENQILYSVANDPTRNAGGFEFKQAGEDGATGDPVLDTLLYPLNPYQTLPGSPNDGYLGSETARANWDALMAELGFYVVSNNVDVAVSQGFNPSPTASQWVGTLKAVTGEEVVVSYYGNTNQLFRYVGQNLPDNYPIQLGWPTIPGQVGSIAVLRWSYNDTVVYSTSLGPGTQPYEFVAYDLTGRFEIVNNTLQWNTYRVSNGALYKSVTFSKQNWINQGIAIDDAISFEPSESVVLGEEYLSFGDTDNPVVGVTYDPSTGVTTYKYKDGTTSTTPPVAMSDTIALSPSITQPLTQYIVNEGDVTNIFNPDAAIPSDSSVPFDFLSLGELFKNTFIPTIAFPYQTIYNRLLNKATFLTVITDIGVRLKNITPKRPEYFIYGVDMFGWIDTIGASNFEKVKSLIAFALKVSMLLGSIALVMKTFHVNVGKGSEG